MFTGKEYTENIGVCVPGLPKKKIKYELFFVILHN